MADAARVEYQNLRTARRQQEASFTSLTVKERQRFVWGAPPEEIAAGARAPPSSPAAYSKRRQWSPLQGAVERFKGSIHNNLLHSGAVFPAKLSRRGTASHGDGGDGGDGSDGMVFQMMFQMEDI